MGRKAQPVLSLVAKGSSHLTKEEVQRRLAGEQAVKPKADNVKPPAWLNAAGKRLFKSIVEDLRELDLLTNVDVHPLAVYCDAVIRYAEASKAVDKEGQTVLHTNKGGATNEVRNPNVQNMEGWARIIRQYAAEFGFTLSARAGLGLNNAEKKPKDPFAERFGI